MMSDHKKLSPELMRRARNTNSAEELLALAKENNIIMTLEEAQQSFEQLHTRSKGEITEEELDNVVGGCSDYNDLGALKVNRTMDTCDYFKGEGCGIIVRNNCGSCDYMVDMIHFEYCGHPANYKK